MKAIVNPVTLGVGLLVVALGIAGVFWMQRGAHVELKGSILKVRTLSLEEKSTVAVIDFRFVNPSDYPFVVRKVEVFLVDGKGERIQGETVSELDAKRLFQYYPTLGQKFNDTLVLRNKVPARQSWDRMIAARFSLPEAELHARKSLVVRVEDVDGPTSEIVEQRL
jgi:hypothetical protein